MSEIKEKLDSLIATDYERELLLKIDDVINRTKLPLLKNVKIGETKRACRILLRYDREFRQFCEFKNVLMCKGRRKNKDELEELARELHAYINDEIAKGTQFFFDVQNGIIRACLAFPLYHFATPRVNVKQKMHKNTKIFFQKKIKKSVDNIKQVCYS